MHAILLQLYFGQRLHTLQCGLPVIAGLLVRTVITVSVMIVYIFLYFLYGSTFSLINAHLFLEVRCFYHAAWNADENFVCPSVCLSVCSSVKRVHRDKP